MLVVSSHLFVTSWRLVINVCKWNKSYTEGMKPPPICEVFVSTAETAGGNHMKLYTEQQSEWLLQF